MYQEELTPFNGRKSFYSKAKIKKNKGEITLYSYDTPIIKYNNGKYMRLYCKDISCTTSSHIISFCGLHKKDYVKLPYRKYADVNVKNCKLSYINRQGEKIRI